MNQTVMALLKHSIILEVLLYHRVRAPYEMLLGYEALFGLDKHLERAKLLLHMRDGVGNKLFNSNHIMAAPID